MSTSSGRSIHTHQKKDATLFKIITGIIVLGMIAVGVIQFSVWVQNRITKGIESSAMETLAQTESLIAENNAEEALELLAPILERVDNPEITPKALLLEAKLHGQAGRKDLAKVNLQRIIDDYPQSSDFPIAAVQFAHILEEDGNRDEALKLYQQIRDTAPPALRASATTALAREKERKNDIDGARSMYKDALSDASWNSESWQEVIGYLGDLNTRMLFSTTHTPDSKVYTVVRGDSLTAIGSKLNITQGQLLRANGLDDPRRLRPNQALKYTPKDFRIIVERSSCRIFLLDGEGIFKVYYSGLGKPGHDTTLGKYKIGNKEKNPVWHKPGASPIPSGDPKNELGSRWLPMVPEEEGLPRDLGIHGTIHPDSIGHYTSKGCPRMHNSEIEELYDLVVRSTPVQVVETYVPAP